MVVLTHSHKLSTLPTTHDKPTSLSKDGRGSDNRRLFNLVAFLVVAAFLTKFIVEFRIQERLKHKSPRPHHNKLPQTIKLEEEEQYEILEIGLHPKDFNNRNASSSQNGSSLSADDSLFQVNIIPPPPPTSLLNISHFKWIRNNESICSENVTPFTKLLPILIHTARHHFTERKAIRTTWASLQNYRNWSVRPVFLIGEAIPGNPNLYEEAKLIDTQLDAEHRLYGDVITGSFVDSYRNLTYKHMMGYKWILEHCTNAAFVLKADDDMFVDVLYFIDKLMTNVTIGTNSAITGTTELFCYEFRSAGPFRSRDSKWYVSEQEWPEAKYPFYCSGWGYGVSLNWLDKIYTMSSQTKYFWVDDVFVGLLIDMAKNFFNEEGPKVESLNGVYTFDNKAYLGMCEQWRNETSSLKNATRKFGSVAYVDRTEEFEWEMECLWWKVLLDRNILE